MKIAWLIFVLCFAFSLGVFAQKDSISARPVWAAGFYGSLSGGYGFFTQPFKNTGIAVPNTSLAGTGGLIQLGGGLFFRNHFGVIVDISVYSAQNAAADLKSALIVEYPGYIVDYQPAEATSKSVDHFSAGFSYAFPYRRWCFQPAILFGSAEIITAGASAQIKEIGTNKVFIVQHWPKNSENRARTLSLGGRASWYIGRHFGLFANTQFLGQWYNVQFRVDKTALIDHSVEKETIQLKKFAFGTTASVGVFLQITRWESTGKSLKALLF
jgi:hypothetical protein